MKHLVRINRGTNENDSVACFAEHPWIMGLRWHESDNNAATGMSYRKDAALGALDDSSGVECRRVVQMLAGWLAGATRMLRMLRACVQMPLAGRCVHAFVANTRDL